MMGGKIGFEDREGGGTTFFFELPVMKPDEPLSGRKTRILVTEQDHVAAEYLVTVLEKGGYHVDTAPDAAATRELLGRWKYGAWLLSRRMNDATDPLALINEMRPRLDGTRIIMLGSLSTDEASMPHANLDVVWLMKSDSRAHILDVVGQAVGRT
jgi:DNA-binding NtrC family response regulator